MATAKDYHSVSGEVEVRDAQSSTVVNVELKPAFGSLSFASDAALNGAVVFVDGEQVGTIPFPSALQVSSGSHQLKMVGVTLVKSSAAEPSNRASQAPSPSPASRLGLLIIV